MGRTRGLLSRGPSEQALGVCLLILVLDTSQKYNNFVQRSLQVATQSNFNVKTDGPYPVTFA